MVGEDKYRNKINTWPCLAVATFAMIVGNCAPSWAAGNCLEACPKGSPTANKIVKRTIYTLSNNPETKFADWVAYKVNAVNFKKTSRHRNWKTDPDLQAGDTMSPKEYNSARMALGVDRGHQAPLGSFKSHPDWAKTNYLSNITPQFTKLNQGAWKELEEAVRKLARNTGKDVYVITGPLYEWPMARLPATDKDHHVPSAYWKVVAIEAAAGARLAGFYFYQDTPGQADYCDHLKSVDFIEEKAGLDFFRAMEKESAIEAAQLSLKNQLGC